MSETVLALPVKPPFRLDLTAWVLRRRAKNAIDTWDGKAYRRVFMLHGEPVLATIHQDGGDLTAKLESDQVITTTRQTELERLIRQTLGLDVDLEPFYELAAGDPTLKALVQQFEGVRPPRFPSLFETLVNAISCQQVSLDVGILLLNRLTASFGRELADEKVTQRAFPIPEDMTGIEESELKQLGFSYQKARAIRDLARTITSGDIDLSHLDMASNDQVLATLQSLRGIGRWSGEYALLRGLGRLDVFPGDDIGGQNNLQRLLQLDARPGYDDLAKLTARWHPYEGLIYFHLLLGKLHGKGLV